MDLPPPPAHPVRPPQTRLSGEEEITIGTTDGQRLEALGLLPDSAVRVVVLCHPHPLYGGTMHNAVVLAITKELARLSAGRVGTIRFNYRGVERSTGSHGEGFAERDDVHAALSEAAARLPRARIGLVGYSFGAAVSFDGVCGGESVDRLALVAPAVRLFRKPLAHLTCSTQVLVVAAGRDQLSPPDEVASLARSLGAACEVLADADHFFLGHRRTVAGIVASFIAPEAYD